MTRLSVLTPGESAEVVALAVSCRGAQRRRLLDLGVVPGTRITSELRGPSGDPTAYRIRGALIALRNDQAAQIYVQKRAGGCQHESALARGVRGVSRAPPRQPPEARRGHDRPRLRGRAGRQSQHRQEHRLQRADRPAPAHRQLAGQDRHARRRRLRSTATSATSWSICPAPTRCCRRASTKRSRATSSCSASPT